VHFRVPREHRGVQLQVRLPLGASRAERSREAAKEREGRSSENHRPGQSTPLRVPSALAIGLGISPRASSPFPLPCLPVYLYVFIRAVIGDQRNLEKHGAINHLLVIRSKARRTAADARRSRPVVITSPSLRFYIAASNAGR